MALEGTLEDMSLPDLFQIFRIGTKSGVLVIQSGDERGALYVYQGRLIDAVLVCAQDRRVLAAAEDAIFALMRWEHATFIFRHDLDVASRQQRIMHDAEWLILEGLRRRVRTIESSSYPQITQQSRFELTALPASAEAGIHLDLDQWRVLSQIAICEDLQEIVQRTGLSLEQGVQLVGELAAIGLITILPPPRAVVKPKTAARSYLPDLLRSPQLTPAYAGHGISGNVEATSSGGRGLLGAIMRRVRGL